MWPWWNDEDADPTVNFRFASYEVEDMIVHIGNRPYKTMYGSKSFAGVTCNQSFFDSIDAWISVTDTPTLLPPKTNYFWFPWWEPEPPHEIAVKSFITTMNQLQDRGFQTVYLHCDAGTHRGPSMFGFWLTHRGITEISPVSSQGHHNPSAISKPLEYAEGYFRDHPEMRRWVKGY